MDSLIQVLEGFDVPPAPFSRIELADCPPGMRYVKPAQLAVMKRSDAARFGIDPQIAAVDDDGGINWAGVGIIAGLGALLLVGVGMARHPEPRRSLRGLGDASAEMERLQRKLESALEKARPMKEIRAIQREIEIQERFERRGRRR